MEGVFATSPNQIVDTTDQITQFDITWTFDEPYEYGQFANGDYWVVGPVTITQISPLSANTSGRIINGSMINPSPQNGSSQGYDSAMSATTYVPTMNVARPNEQDLSVGNPLIVQNDSSLVSSISMSEAGHRPQLQTAAILTVLDSAPSESSFRPSFSGDDKSVAYNTNQIDWSLLAQLTPVSETPSLTTVANYFERPWIDHIPGYVGREHHPEDNMPDYGRELSTQVGIGALMLHLDFSNAEKETLLIRYLQLGIDWYGIVQDGGNVNWSPNGGHASGRKWPIVFAGLMLDVNEMVNIGPGDGSGTVYFGEDAQTFYVAQDDVDLTHNPDLRECYAEEYEHEDIGLPEWGIRHATIPSRDNKAWCAAYRQCCTATAWSGFVLAAHIMDAKTEWAHDPLFDYMDRYMGNESTNSAWRCWDDFTEEMWDTYRADYGTVWPGYDFYVYLPVIVRD